MRRVAFHSDDRAVPGAALGMAALALLCAGLVLVLAQWAWARSAPVSAASQGNLRLSACIAPQRSGDTAAALLADPGRFDCRRAQSAWGPGNYWLRFTLPPGHGEAQRQFRFVPNWQSALEVFTHDAKGGLIGRAWTDATLSRRIGIGGAVGVPLLQDSGQDTVLVRVDGALNATGLLGDPQLLRGDGLHAEELIATAAFAAFAGLGLGLFCYNMVLWLTIRERFQLTYCLSLLAMLAYAWAYSGTMAVQFPAIAQSVRLQTSYLMLAFVGALALQFITDFIEPGKLPKWLRLVARYGGVPALAAAAALILVPPEWRFLADRLYVASFLPLPPLVVAVTLCAWRQGSRSIKVLMIAWAMPLAMALLRIAHALHLIEFGPVVQYSLIAAMSVEALLSSLAMSFRIKLITDERDRAIADERAARHLASVDSLTGLLNRRALLEQVIAWRSPEPLRLLLVDIDRFKQINDQHGHLVGDEVLAEVAELLAMRAELRGSVARLGGEEFAVIGTAAELHEGLALAVLANMRAHPLAGHVRLTVSIGMAEGMVRCEDEWRELYRRADAALYQAKSEGRNRAVHAEPGARDMPCAEGLVDGLGDGPDGVERGLPLRA